MPFTQNILHPRKHLPNDDEQLAALAAHDPDAFATLYRLYMPRIYGYLLARTGHTQDAEDLTAQTFLAVIEALPTYRSQTRFAAWLYGIARHKLADHFRQRPDPLPLERHLRVQLDAPLLEEVIAQKLQVETVAHAMQNLSPDRADALALSIFADMTAAEIGQVMGRSEDAVRMLVFRALRDLRERLSYMMQEV